MEYKFMSTTNGPAVVAEDEIVFFFEYGPLQDYIDEDPEFFNKAFDFFKEVLAEQYEFIVQSVTEDVPGNDWMNRFNNCYSAAVNLRQFQQNQIHQHGFPADNPPV
jgi:hypothetical protein